MQIAKGDHVLVPVITHGDKYRYKPGVVEQILGRHIYVRYECGGERLLGCWFPEDLRRRDA